MHWYEMSSVTHQITTVLNSSATSDNEQVCEAGASLSAQHEQADHEQVSHEQPGVQSGVHKQSVLHNHSACKQPLACKQLLRNQASSQRTSSNKYQVAVFDFDGTSINGNSPVLLVDYLRERKMLKTSELLRIGLWALAYKLRLPQNEEWVRGLVFRAFAGKSTQQVNAFFREFYAAHIEPRFRRAADEEMQRLSAEHKEIIMISASFDPLVRCVLDYHPIQYQCSTHMKIANDGTYLPEVDGIATEGMQKLVALRELCDRVYGKDKWELYAAYGDHHSDRPLLQAARHAYAVCPDRPLLRTARAQGWSVLRW